MHPLHHSSAHTLLGAPCLHSSLQPLGTLWDPQLLMGAGYREIPGDAEHVHRGTCTGSLMGAHGVGVDGMGAWCWGIVWVGIVSDGVGLRGMV